MAREPGPTFPPIVFQALAAVFLGAAVFHLLGLVAPDRVSPEPRWRHAAYFCLDLVNAFYIRRHPKWQVALLWVLAADQVCSHGEVAYEAWTRAGRIEWISIGALIFMPLTLFVVTTNGLRRRARRA